MTDDDWTVAAAPATVTVPAFAAQPPGNVQDPLKYKHVKLTLKSGGRSAIYRVTSPRQGARERVIFVLPGPLTSSRTPIPVNVTRAGSWHYHLYRLIRDRAQLTSGVGTGLAVASIIVTNLVPSSGETLAGVPLTKLGLAIIGIGGAITAYIGTTLQAEKS